ncbi:hypothetical protein HIU27_RS05125 [Escherichia coli]|uniref:hypothetical protein n=1 Tax=Escherichia coli TaxID=562 RepID=UPI000A4CD3D9|nr:hypothetical protein [Escherichia coli]EER9146645.1 hypothetical protein [Escherichia coli]EEU2029549.1 hypothetical protein [Escherichia coli]EEW5072073.1 hypothetical protein [Escherichia coli]EEX1985484.1 hypothetical protein [Escherichia coli]EEX2584793.1 hypothetical protein [Escherichia coli]
MITPSIGGIRLRGLSVMLLSDPTSDSGFWSGEKIFSPDYIPQNQGMYHISSTSYPQSW